MKSIITTYILSLLLMGAASAAETAAHKMDRFTKNVGISQPTTIKIINHYGDIRIRKADDDQFIYHGVAQSQKSQEVTLDFKQTKDSITATVVFSDPNNTNHLDRFDLALIVPSLVSLDIEIEKGQLTTKGLASALRVKSENADIQVKTSGPVDLFTKKGSIDLNVKASKIKINSNIQAYDGSVNVTYYADMPRFEINTGSVVSSNSVPLLNSLTKAARTAFYGDSDNNHHVKIKTDTGQIRLIDTAQ